MSAQLNSELTTTRPRLLGAAFVAAMIAVQSLWLGLPAVLLSVGLAISYLIWLATDWRSPPRLRPAVAVMIAVFLLHLAEEYATGVHRELPALFDRPAWSGFDFLAFNATWGALFVAAWWRLPGRQFPVLVVIFLALIGGIANGLAHLLMALSRGGYFSGALTAPLCLLTGIWLLRLLYGGTSK